MQDLSVYFDDLAEMAQKVEDAVSEQRCSKTPQQEQTITELQGLDYLRQALNDLALLTSILGQYGSQDVLSSQTTAEIEKTLNLNDIKAIVCRNPNTLRNHDDGVGHGVLDLF
ncbi:MAG: hypothetical protein WA790_09365 [Sulfitobacter sp.]